MKVILFLDQLQAGLGGKYDTSVPLGVEKGGIGSYGMFSSLMPSIDAVVVCTIYCGSVYYFDNREDVTTKIVKLLDKVKADVVICGPCFDFSDYANMAGDLATYIQANSDIKVVMACSKECSDAVSRYKDTVTIVQMPKKGGVGLNDSLKNLVSITKKVYDQESLENVKEQLF